MHEVKQPLEIGLMCKSHASKAMQRCLYMIKRKEDVNFHFLLRYHDCLNDFQLTDEITMDFESPNEMFVIEKDLMIRNITKCLHKTRRKDADADGYWQCLLDLGLVGEDDESCS